MLEKRGGLEKGCVRKEGRFREGACYKRGAGKRRGVLERRGGLEKGCVRKKGRVREGVCKKRGEV